MAAYTVAAGDTGVEPFVMVASQVDTVTFAENVTRIEVISDGAAEVRVTNGGSTPAIGTAGSSTIAFRLPAGSPSVREIPMPKDTDAVKIVSSGTPTVSVNVVR